MIIMRTLAFSSLLWHFLMIICSTTSILRPTLRLQVMSAGQCLSDEKSLLLRLKNSLTFSLDGMLPWNQSTDCCTWEAVSCQKGRVVGLDLSFQFINGGLTDNSSLFHFRYLETLDLSSNNFSSPIPSRIGNLTSLIRLNLADSSFVGQVPIEISRLTNLVTLDLSRNWLKVDPSKSNGRMFFQNLTKLEKLYLDSVNMSAVGNKWGRVFSSSLPHHLQTLSLSHSSLSVIVPRSFGANFSQLMYLSLDGCRLYGSFPRRIFQVPTLVTIDISRNELLQVSLPQFSQNNSLQELDLSNTCFSGRLPTSISNLTNLTSLYLSNSQIKGTLSNFMPITPLSKLQILDLSGNNLEGPIPMSMFQLKNLWALLLSDNKLNGTIQLDILGGLVDLVSLDLSRNNLSLTTVNASASAWPSFPKNISTLSLASCKLNIIPNLKDHSELTALDLSDNQIQGPIPNWIWDLGSESGGLSLLNLSHNFLEGLQEPYTLPSRLFTIDLHSNQIRGKIPPLPQFALYIYLSSNKFDSSIPANIGNNSPYLELLYLSNNALTGVIPKSICNFTQLQILDLSSNKLSGRIPDCLSVMSNTSRVYLGVLNLRGNNLSGTIPDSFPVACGLTILHLNENSIGGQIPKSLAYCTELEVLDLGNNNMIDEFPCFLNNISTLRVLILRSNKFHGGIGCSKDNNNETSWALLQIIDLAHNSFDGQLSGHNFFANWKAMMSSGEEDNDQEDLDHVQNPISWSYYVDSTTVTFKGHERFLVKILDIYICIDFSSNNFNGQIPEELGALSLLYALNLSNNAFSGPIPRSSGNLKSLESLDLSRNKLNGTIPTSLASLNFLSHLNLSFNRLAGMIPSGAQFQTFPANSFVGNQGLYGCPLTTNCTLPDHSPPPDHDKHHSAHSESKKIDWHLISVEIGFVVGLGSIIGPLVFCKRWRNLYYETFEDFAFKILPLAVTRKWLSWTSAR